MTCRPTIKATGIPLVVRLIEHASKGEAEPHLERLWPHYLRNGYFDENGNLRPDFLLREKVEPLVKQMSEAKPKLTNHQLRRFFQHCRAIEAKLKASTSTWGAELANFKKLDIAAADAFGKSSKKIPGIFHDFIKTNVAAVKSEKDLLEGFLPHFEALVGFGTQFLQDR